MGTRPPALAPPFAVALQSATAATKPPSSVPVSAAEALPPPVGFAGLNMEGIWQTLHQVLYYCVILSGNVISHDHE